MSADEIALRFERIAWDRALEAARAVRERSNDDVDDDETMRQLRRRVRDSLVSLGTLRAARRITK